MDIKVRFTRHAKDKLLLLTKIGITKEKVIKTIMNPEKIENGYWGRKIAQSSLENRLVVRVVYEKKKNEILIITVYPGERRRYENKI